MLVENSTGQNLQSKQIKRIWGKHVVLPVLLESALLQRAAGVQLGSQRKREEVILHCSVAKVKLQEYNLSAGPVLCSSSPHIFKGKSSPTPVFLIRELGITITHSIAKNAVCWPL